MGDRWTHIILRPYLNASLLTVFGTGLNASTVANTLMLVSIVYVAWRHSVEQSRRQSSLEQEFRSAQELQQLIIPEKLPALPGYAVTSAYRPAQEVGGDFFQLVALPNDAAMLVIGDVSGKGLGAAMAVALIVGALRSTVEVTDDPAAVLAALNRRLHGRLRGGFATCLVMHLNAQGKCLIANGGHLPPFLNGQEVPLPPALPLGLVENAEFESIELQMAAGDQLTLYTDGLLEARNPAGELFGFQRIADFLARPRDAQEIAEAAQQFGQEDDITVLSLTVVPVLEPPGLFSVAS
jgi:serine phosphatase RsbU (regulator of sigma subunit)